MAVIIQPGFYDVSLELSDPFERVDIPSTISNTLSRALGWDEDGLRWRPVQVDEQGRLVVNPMGGTYDLIDMSYKSVTGAPQMLVIPNPNRLGITVYNRSVGEVRYTYETGLHASTYGQIFSYDTLERIGYTGPIWLWTPAGGSTVVIEEW